MPAPSPPRPAAAGFRVQIQGVRRVFPGGVVAVDGVDLDLAPGSFVALLGPSGCGKSTLLRLVAGLDRPSEGAVLLDGAEVRLADRPPIAYVFQDPHLLPWRSVLDNAALPLELAGIPRAERRDRARAALDRVDLADAADRYPAELSGGMKMRASLARALVTRPRLLLLDEPFASLDELTRNRLDDQLRALWSSIAVTVIFVTHSIVEAAYLAERAIVFTRRPARIVADHAVDLPRERAGALRTEASFAAQTRVLFDALEQGDA
ncbi:MAG: ABC transporter ATP-binding protein [Minicystis sp.]